RRQPGFTAAVVLTLALGVGFTTATFALVYAIILKPLPYPAPHELVSLEHRAPGIDLIDLPMSAPQFFTYREEGRVFQHVGLFADAGATITGLSEPEW